MNHFLHIAAGIAAGLLFFPAMDMLMTALEVIHAAAMGGW